MTPLLAPESFPGAWISAAGAGASWVGEAWFDGVVVSVAWPRSIASALLPPGWSLAAAAAPETSTHPILLLFGRQRDTAVLFAGMALPTDVDYDEAIVLVPFVRHRAGRLLHVFAPRMYSGDARATWSGNAHYGFGKRPGAISRLGRSLAVTDRDGALVMSLTVHERGAWCRADATAVAPEVDALGRLAALPVVGRRGDGRDVASYFDWSFACAELRPVWGSVSVEHALAPGRGSVAPPDAAVTRGVEVRRLRWRLSWPEPCRP